jgi:hypothetical protein
MARRAPDGCITRSRFFGLYVARNGTMMDLAHAYTNAFVSVSMPERIAVAMGRVRERPQLLGASPVVPIRRPR